jgi:L-ascorbate metabolism protein UlaG (beta-lactamase superfamily)
MKRRSFLQGLLLFLTAPLLAQKSKKMNPSNIRLLRHATLVVELHRKKILVDPMLSAKGELDPVQNCGNETRIPMVDLPLDEKELDTLLTSVDAILVTHIHRDHWDVAAQKRIDKNKQIFCQPGDEIKIREQGFTQVKVIETSTEWEGIRITRTGGQHGTGEIGKKMGNVSGFVLKAKEESIYIAGDTIWCEEVKKALTEFKPKVTVLNTGGAKFLTGDPITMTPADVISVQEQLPSTRIIAMHMDTVNHCFIRRTDLAQALTEKKINVLIPKDGETVPL